MGKTGARSCSSSAVKTTEERLEEITAMISNIVTKTEMDKKIEHITDTMEEKFARLKEDIRKENRELFDKYEGRVFQLEKENEELRQTVGNLETMCLELQEAQKESNSRYNSLEQQGRKNSVRIFGMDDPTEKETVEECKEKVISLVNSKLKLELSGDDIDIAHRLGKFARGKKRGIIVKFTHRTKKHEILKNRRLLKGTGITIFEDLTQRNQDRLREAYRLECVRNTYSVDGKLFIILNDGRKRRLFDDTPLNCDYLMRDGKI